MQVPGQKSFGAATTFVSSPLELPPFLITFLWIGFGMLAIDFIFLKKRYIKKFGRWLNK
jgi:hypothetical protein